MTSLKHHCFIQQIKPFIPFKAELPLEITKDSDFSQLAYIFTWEIDLGYGFPENPNAHLFINYLYKHNIEEIIFSGIYEEQARINILKELIRTCKYTFCIERLIYVDDSMDAYLFDVAQSLECLFVLIRKSFYRQSFQILRSILEDCVAHVFWGLKQDYSLEKEPPNFRTGKVNMLDFLLEKDFIQIELHNRLSTIYRVLSKQVHANPEALNHYYLFLNTPEYELMKNWSQIVSEMGECILLLLVKSIEVDF